MNTRLISKKYNLQNKKYSEYFLEKNIINNNSLINNEHNDIWYYLFKYQYLSENFIEKYKLKYKNMPIIYYEMYMYQYLYRHNITYNYLLKQNHLVNENINKYTKRIYLLITKLKLPEDTIKIIYNYIF